MTSLKVAIRVRPLSERESILGSDVVVDVQGKDILVTDEKVPENHCYDHRVRVHRFTFDFGFWSVDPGAKKYASQEMVYEEFGRVVLNTVLQGYNSCVIAYGPSGSGKTYTIMGSKEENGLTPRICEGLFTKLTKKGENHMPFQIDISFMEIYNEQVYDLLQKKDSLSCRKPKLRVREHPINGPFVEGLSTHIVKNIDDVCDLLARGNECRVKAATHIHDRSSRSHAIFTIRCSQACINKSEPREVVSKLHLVDLAGSEKAAPDFCQSRVKEGGNINKSLVTLGNVISVLVELSLRSQNGEANHRQTYVPYRDSYLTWLLKDSLGGNSHTFMLAAISPSKECYIETVSTLRYAQRAKFVLNKPVVNEDPGTEMIRNLQIEVQRLRNLLITAEKLNKKFIIKPLPDIIQLRKIMEESSRKVDIMTKHWFEKWLETYDVVLNEVAKQNGIVSTYNDNTNEYGLPETIKDKDNTVNKLEKNDSSILAKEIPAVNTNEERFVESSECLILQHDTVGFSKKKCDTDKNQNRFSQKQVENTFAEENVSNIDIFSNYKKGNISLIKKKFSNSDNTLHKQNITLPFFKCLSLGGINVTYPYCNYSWVTQKQTRTEVCTDEEPKNKEHISSVTSSADEVENNNISINHNNFTEVGAESNVQNLNSIYADINFQNQQESSVLAENVENDGDDTDALEMLDVYDSLECIPSAICESHNESHTNACVSDAVNESICISREISNNFQQLTKVNFTNNKNVKENDSEQIILAYSEVKDAEHDRDSFNICKEKTEKETSQDNLKCYDVKFDDKVREESKNFLDLLTRVNVDGRDYVNGVDFSKRKDSEIMSLLSFSSLDCPVWKSLDDFLASSEDASSIPEREQSEGTQFSNLNVRNSMSYEIPHYNFSTNSQDLFKNGCKTELPEKMKTDENTMERNDFSISRQIKFVDFASKANGFKCFAADSESKEAAFSLERNIINTFNNVHNHNVDTSPKTFCTPQLPTNDNKNYQSFTSCADHINDTETIFENSVRFLKEKEVLENDAKLAVDSNSFDNPNSKTLMQFDGENIAESNNVSAICTSASEIFSPTSSTLKLTKENLDLLAEKLNKRPKANVDCFNTCAAFALDVNNANNIRKLEEKFIDENHDNQNLISSKKFSEENSGNFDETEKSIQDENFVSVNDPPKNIIFEIPSSTEKSQIPLTGNDGVSSNYLLPDLFSNNEKFENTNDVCNEAVNIQNGTSKIWERKNYFENINFAGNIKFFDNHYFGKAQDNKSNFIFTKSLDSNEVNNISRSVDEEKDESLNNTIASDSLDNFEQEMIDWAKKYLTRNTSDASSLYALEKMANSQSIDAKELGLDEFEFSAKSNTLCYEGTNDSENMSLKNQEITENLNNLPAVQNTSTLESSRSSSPDSITYVFLGKDTDNRNNNFISSAHRYSSLPGSVSLDSLEKNAFRTKPPCISPRTLSIDSLIAEELLTQLQNSELPPSFKVENITQAQDMSTSNLQNIQNPFADNIYNSVRKKIGKMYETNIIEVLSPESNCSFDTSSSNKDILKKNNETLGEKADLEEKPNETHQNTYQPLNDRLQRISLGTSECFVNNAKYLKSPVKKSATNSEIYKTIEENKEKSPEISFRTSFPYESTDYHHKRVGSTDSSTQESQTLNFINANLPSSYSTKEIIMQSIVVPPPTSFSTDEKVQIQQNINRYDKCTQTSDVLFSIPKANEHNNEFSSNTADIILRMVEMLTETIKFLKSENAQLSSCRRICPHRIPKERHERRKMCCDEFEKSSVCTSSSSSASIDYPAIVKNSCERCDRRFICENIEAKKTEQHISSCCKHKKKQKNAFLNPTVLHCRHYHNSPQNSRNEELISKCTAKYEEINDCLSCVPQNDYFYNALSSRQHRCENESYEANSCHENKSPNFSELLQTNKRRCANKMIKEHKDVHSNRKISHDKQKRRCCDKCSKVRHHQIPGCHSTPTNFSSSEGYLSSISSVTQHKHSDDTDSALMEENFKGTISKPLTSKAKKLKPLVLNKCLEDGTLTPNASWQNTSADSGAFFMDSPLTENKNFSTANRSPDASNSFLLQPFVREMPFACEKEINAICRKATASKSRDINQQRLYNHQDDAQHDYSNMAQTSASKNSLTEKAPKNVNLKDFSEMPSYYLKDPADMEEEEYLDINFKPSCKPFTKSSSLRRNLNQSREHSKQSSSSEDFVKKLSDKNYSITRADIERILASIERDKQFLRRRRNLIFESRYSPEIKISSPTEDDDLSDSYKSLPKPVLYVDVP